MKRSEMQNLIEKALDDKCEDTMNCAILAFNAIINAGMLPPPTMRYVDQENGNTLCSEVCEWDEE